RAGASPTPPFRAFCAKRSHPGIRLRLSCASRAFGALLLNQAREVERRDAHPLVEIQAMGVRAVRAHSGIEVKLVASEPFGLVDHPVQQLACVTLAPMLRTSREVIAVEGPAPCEHMHDAETRRRGGLGVVLNEKADHPVTLWP